MFINVQPYRLVEMTYAQGFCLEVSEGVDYWNHCAYEMVKMEKILENCFLGVSSPICAFKIGFCNMKYS